MMKRSLFVQILLAVSCFSFAQGVGIGTTTPDASSALDITATNKGLLIPRMNINSINSIINPAKGLLVYDSAANQLMVNLGTPAAPNWQPVAASNSNGAWILSGNSGTNPANQFVGTTDNKALRFRVNNIQAGELNPLNGNILWGLRAGQANTAGFSNIAIGTDALKFDRDGTNLVAIGDSALFNNGKDNPAPGAFGISNTAIGSKSLFSNTIGAANTAVGRNTLFANIDGTSNSAYGVGALFSNTRGNQNTAIGTRALLANTTGNLNTAVGSESLSANTIGVFNSAFGSFSLQANTTGDNNTATGFASLNLNTTGAENTATGIRSLFSNTTGDNNTATGSQALFSNTSGEGNTATGVKSLLSNTTGGLNTAVGFNSLFSNTTGNSNTAAGFQSLRANTTGSRNTAAGLNSLASNTVGGNNTASGFQSLASNTIGNANTATGNQSLFSNTTGINNTAIGNASLFLNTTGTLNTANGAESLQSNTSGGSNTGIGFQSVGSNTTGIQNTAVGTFSLVTNTIGSLNTAIGFGADVSSANLTNAAAIGAGAIVDASNKIRLGNGAVTVIEGQVPFTTPSDGRFKFNIKEDVKGLDFIMQLRPVTYQFDVHRFDHQWSGTSNTAANDIVQASYNEATVIRRTGFIAQEVEKAAIITGYNFSGIIKPKTEKDHYGLSYEAFVVPLVKAVQEQQQIISEQQLLLDVLKKQNADLQKRVLNLEKR